MNKKFGLLLLSCALLSSCSTFEKAPIVDNEFKDTTDANNDGIGAIGDGKKLRQAALLDDPEPITFVQPKLGYQYKIDGGNISVRYVAAISSTNVKAVWKRTIFTNTGAVYKEEAQKTSTKYYTAVINPNNDDKTENAVDVVADDDSKPYVGFVVYTLLNVPLATYKDYHLSVSLTLTDINFEKNTITSQVGNVYFGRYTGIRMIGTFGEGDYAYDVGYASDDVGDSGNRFQKSNVSLNAGDEFVFRDYGAAVDYGYDKLDAGAKPMFEKGSVENSLRVLVSGTYTFYLNGSNILYVNSDLGYYLAKFEVNDWKITTNAIKSDTPSGTNKADFHNIALTAGTKFQIVNFELSGTAYYHYNLDDNKRNKYFYGQGDDMVSGYSNTYNFYNNKDNRLYFDLVTPKEETIYFENTDNWSNVYIYPYNNKDDELAGWPGRQMEYDEEKGLYKYSVDVSKWAKVIFNNKPGDTGPQTGDLDFEGNKFNWSTGWGWTL